MTNREKCFICDRWVASIYLTEDSFNGSMEKICFACANHLKQADTEQITLKREEQARGKAPRQRIPEIGGIKHEEDAGKSD